MTRTSLLLLGLLVGGQAALHAQAPMDLNLLVLRRGVYLERPSFEPYSGPVLELWDGQNVRQHGTLMEGRWDGLREVFYETGQLAVKETYTQGVLDGPFESNFRMGSPSDRGTYRNGRLDGSYESYWLRQLAEQGSWSDGQMCGEWVSYFPKSSYGLRIEATETYPPCPTREG